MVITMQWQLHGNDSLAVRVLLHGYKTVPESAKKKVWGGIPCCWGGSLSEGRCHTGEMMSRYSGRWGCLENKQEKTGKKSIYYIKYESWIISSICFINKSIVTLFCSIAGFHFVPICIQLTDWRPVNLAYIRIWKDFTKAFMSDDGLNLSHETQSIALKWEMSQFFQFCL